VILAVRTDGDWRFEDPRGDVSRIVAAILDELAAPTGPGASSPIAELTFSPHRWEGPIADADNRLFASVNGKTGFGALTWYVLEGWPQTGGIYDDIWVTDNPHPVDFDPRVPSDPDSGAFYHPASAVTLDRVRTALEEFCTVGTGDRPECVSWVPGRIDGWRLDAAPPEREPGPTGWEPYEGSEPESPWPQPQA
jgi:hypothetical protein